MKPKPSSPSALSSFETCGRRFYETRIAKSVPDPSGPAAEFGTAVHLSLENYCRSATPIPAPHLRYQAAADKILALPGDKLFEQRVGIRADFSPCAFDDPDVWHRCIIDVLILNGTDAAVVDWKGLALDTPIPTPTGWTTMGEVQVGDQLIGGDGKPTTVMGKSKVKEIPCWRIGFQGGESIVCDEEHLWTLSDGHTLTTPALAARLASRKNGVNRPRINCVKPLDLPQADLPIDPYVLGLWLADGKHTSSEISKPDPEAWAEIQRRGYVVDMTTGGTKCPTRTVQGVRGHLAKLNLLGNKHIPKMYLRASVEQRLDLLRGLMDGDGNANPTRHQAVFTNTNKELALHVRELVLSLGCKATVYEHTAKGFGLTITAYTLTFRPQGWNPFLLPRKADRYNGKGCKAAGSWLIKTVERVETVPTQCIMVDAADHLFLCGERMIPTHNTGKKKGDLTQLNLNALVTFAHFPEVQTIALAYYWLTQGPSLTQLNLHRSDLTDLWARLLPRLKALDFAYEHDRWLANPSGLCRNYCPVSSCQFHGGK